MRLPIYVGKDMNLKFSACVKQLNQKPRTQIYRKVKVLKAIIQYGRSSETVLKSVLTDKHENENLNVQTLKQ